MKTYFKHSILILLISLFFASCQDEAVQLNLPNAVETITANSALSNLMLRTSANTTSDDDVLDNTSCFSVELPVTVTIGNITITIENEDGLDELEELLESFEGEIPEFVFPITIVSADFTETVIENQAQLEAIVENCIELDSIDCIDFVYPISFSEFNTDFAIINTVTINSNAELYAYLDNLEDDDANLVALNFPLTLQYANGDTLEVNSNVELSDAIVAASEACDDDDEDDCDVDEVRLSLKECRWKIEAYSSFPEFEDLQFEFNDDFSFGILFTDGTVLTDDYTWEIAQTDNGLIVTINANFEDIGGEWLVVECDDDELYLIKGNQTMVIKKHCEGDLDCDAENLSHELVECYWLAGSNLLDTTNNLFNFFEDGTVKVNIDNNLVVIGQWNIGVEGNSLTLVLNLTGEYEPLSGVWEVTDCHDGFFGLEKDGTILHLEQDCSDNTNPFECYPSNGVTLEKCDDDTDGFAIFNMYEAVPNCSVNVPVQIGFYLSSSGAENNTDVLQNATAFTNTVNPQTVYVKVALSNNPSEFMIYPVELIVINCNEPSPFECFESFDAVLEQCDDNYDGVEVFNLPIAYDNCTPTADMVSYHNTLSDAQSNVNAIVNPEAYTSTNLIETIYVRVEIQSQVQVFELLIKIIDCTNTDCTEGDVDGILSECAWKVTEFNGDDYLITYRLTFNANQELIITNIENDQTVNATWSTSTNTSGNVDVTFDGVNAANIQAISGVWTIVECTASQLIFHKDDEQMTLARICE